MSVKSGTFSATGQASKGIVVKPGDQIGYTLTVADTESFIGTVKLQTSKDGGQSYQTQATHTGTTGTPLEGAAVDSTFKNVDGEQVLARLICELLDTDESSDNISYTMTALESVVKNIKLKDGEFVTEDGKVLMRFKENTVQFPNAIDVDGAADFAGEVTQAQGVGAKNGATVTVQEFGDGAVHKTVFTFDNTPISIVSVTTGNGVGGTKVYDFPAGYIRVLGGTADLSLAVETEDDYTDGTPEGDIGVGTVAPANADALGTDATDDNILTAAGFTMSDFAATADLSPEAALNLNGTSTPVAVFLNALVDAGDIDDDTTTNLLVSGTMTLVWANLGDF